MKIKKIEEYFRITTACVFCFLISVSAYILKEMLAIRSDPNYLSPLRETFPDVAQTILSSIVMYLIFAAGVLYFVSKNMNYTNRKGKK